jgi:hypothetical protein
MQPIGEFAQQRESSNVKGNTPLPAGVVLVGLSIRPEKSTRHEHETFESCRRILSEQEARDLVEYLKSL